MRRRTVAIAVLACAAAAAAAVLVVPRLLRPRLDVDALVTRLDAALAAGSLGTVRDELRGLARLPSSEADLVRIVARAVRLSEAGGDWTALRDLGTRALAARPRSATLRAATAWAQLRTGQVAAALRTAGRGPLPPVIGENLRGEAALRSGAAWTGSDALTRDLLALSASRDASLYAAAALRAGDERLSLDAALLAMQAGMPDQARSLVSDRLGASVFDEAAAAILYDTGDPAAALERLQRTVGVRGDTAGRAFLMADILVSMGHDAQAETALARGVALDPGLSWIPWADLALMAGARGDYATAEARMGRGLQAFPRSRELAVVGARVAVARGDSALALARLAPVISADPGNVDAVLLSLDLQSPPLTPEARRAKLWKLYDLNLGEPRALSALMDELFALQDWAGAGIALAQAQAARGEPAASTLVLQGVVAALRGDGATAVTAFQQAAVLQRDGTPRYDMALVQLASGNTRGARSSLEVARSEYERSGDPLKRNAFFSRVSAATGEALLMEGGRSGARTAFQQALALDPTNLRASLLLRKLDGPSQ